MKKRNLFAVVFFCLVAGLSLLMVIQIVTSRQEQEGQINGTSSNILDIEEMRKDIAHVQTLEVPEIVKYFRQISTERGAPYAYQVLRGLPHSNLDRYVHLFGHVIGDELYNQQSINGLKICTSEFSFACYHSILARAIAEQGLEKISDINQMCLELKARARCQHGIGHGVLAATGYEEPLTAFAVCKTLAKQGSTIGCVEGVMMEYNLRSLEDVGSSTPRKVDKRGYYYPCSEVVNVYKNECYLEQSLWWRELLGMTNYVAMDALCAEVGNEENRSWCYRGIGSLIFEVSDDPVDTKAKQCVTGISGVKGQAWCLQMLRHKTKNDGSICKVLHGTNEKICESPVPEMLI